MEAEFVNKVAESGIITLDLEDFYPKDETADFLHKTLFLKNIEQINVENYKDQRVVIKGCGELPISETAYVAITNQLRPVVKSIMYGEPCSTMPVYKKPRAI